MRRAPTMCDTNGHGETGDPLDLFVEHLMGVKDIFAEAESENDFEEYEKIFKLQPHARQHYNTFAPGLYESIPPKDLDIEGWNKTDKTNLKHGLYKKKYIDVKRPMVRCTSEIDLKTGKKLDFVVDDRKPFVHYFQRRLAPPHLERCTRVDRKEFKANFCTFRPNTTWSLPQMGYHYTHRI